MTSPDAADLGRLRYSFSIVGVQKAGTSTLSAMLYRHRQVARPPNKELHYFDDEDRDWERADHADYVVPRRHPDEVVVGDNTPSYILHPFALRRMRDVNPGMRLVAVFRDPVERLFSHWAMARDKWQWTPDWSVFITERRPATLFDSFPANARPRRYIAKSGVARGFYGAQLERGFALFPREQWLLLDFRTMLADHRRALDLTTDHLGIERFTEHPRLLHRMSGPASVPGTPPTGEELLGLAEHYRSDLELFRELSGFDLSGWPTQRMLAGDLDPAELAAKLATKVDATSPVRAR
jgi:hypothetical protein